MFRIENGKQLIMEGAQGFVPFWVSKDGTAQPVSTLTTPHLTNIIKTYVLIAQAERQTNPALADFSFDELLSEQTDFQILWTELRNRGQDAVDAVILYDLNIRNQKVEDPRITAIVGNLKLLFKET